MRILLVSLTLFLGLAGLSALGSPLKVLTSPSHEDHGAAILRSG